MRTRLLACVLSAGILACGAAKPPDAPTSPADAGKTGVAVVAPDLDANADVTVFVDLAGIRANPVFASFLSDRAKDRAPAIADLLAKVDRVDVRASLAGLGTPDIVAVVWGRLPKDPSADPVLGFAFEEGPALMSGVKEYVNRKRHGSSPAAHVFVVRDGVWVLTMGAATKGVRASYATTAIAPSAPSGDLLRVRANRLALERSPRTRDFVDGIDKIDVTLGSSAGTLHAALTFREAETAKTAAAKLRSMTTMLSLMVAADGTCRAFEKLSIDVKHDAKDVVIDVKGIADAIAAWDEQACARGARQLR